MYSLAKAICTLALVAGLTAGCGTDTSPSSSGRMSVAASFYPIEFMAERVGGELVDAYNPVPPGAEPHDLELTPPMIERIQNSKVFLYLGHGFQPAIDRALDTVANQTTLRKDVSEGIETVPPTEVGSPADPHIWLDPVRAGHMAANIEAAFSQADPANSATYGANVSKLRDDLSTLDREFKQGLANCARKEIITSHAAFAALAQRYGLVQVPVSGLTPEAEPSPAQLSRIIAFAKAHDAEYIFFETLVSPAVAELIATESGAKTLELNPIEGLTPEQQDAGSDYFNLMRQNLANLKLALGCN